MAAVFEEFVQEAPSKLNTWASNFTNNTRSSFSRLTYQDWFRIIAVLGGYMLIIRPFLVRFGAKIQTEQHIKAAEDNDVPMSEIDPRTGMPRKMQIPGVDSDSEEDEEGVKADTQTGEWGRKARLRQRKVVRVAMERQERRLAGDDDKDIEEFLQD
jgi:hypothetical protein